MDRKVFAGEVIYLCLMGVIVTGLIIGGLQANQSFALDRHVETMDPGTAVSEDIIEDKSQVYITETGSCFHLKGCQYLQCSNINISLKEAEEKGYCPCQKCYPIVKLK